MVVASQTTVWTGYNLDSLHLQCSWLLSDGSTHASRQMDGWTKKNNRTNQLWIICYQPMILVTSNLSIHRIAYDWIPYGWCVVTYCQHKDFWTNITLLVQAKWDIHIILLVSNCCMWTPISSNMVRGISVPLLEQYLIGKFDLMFHHAHITHGPVMIGEYSPIWNSCCCILPWHLLQSQLLYTLSHSNAVVWMASPGGDIDKLDCQCTSILIPTGKKSGVGNIWGSSIFCRL